MADVMETMSRTRFVKHDVTIHDQVYKPAHVLHVRIFAVTSGTETGCTWPYLTVLGYLLK